MSSRPDLKLDWCSHEAAKYACEHWHYSRSIPRAKLNCLGVWEEGRYIGCVIFSYGANNNIGKPFGLSQQECIELTRVAISTHKTPITKIVSISIKLLKSKNPRLKLIVSYADQNEGHFGGIYQGGNWTYIGQTATDGGQIINGHIYHRRTVYDKFGTNSIQKLKKIGIRSEYYHNLPKFKYLYPLSDDMRRKIEPLRKPYPKKEKTSVSSVAVSTSSFHEESGGSTPTLTHQKI